MAAGSKSAAEERPDEGAVELSLRLRTGSSSSSGSSAAAAEARRSMTIFYDGRVCAVDVTELQARTIITMANHQILTERQLHRIDSDRHLQDSSSSSNSAGAQCGGHQHPKPRAPQCSTPLLASPPRPQGLIGAAEGTRVAPMVSHTAAAGLSMKRSLQHFLQKRKTRVAAVGSPYAGGRPTRHSAMPS
ncbi:unnamed protein product [Alopecurus aequalis]